MASFGNLVMKSFTRGENWWKMHIKLGGLSIFRVIIWLYNVKETILSSTSCQFMMIFIINLKILSYHTCSNFQHIFIHPLFGSHFSIFHIFIFFTVHKIVYFTSHPSDNHLGYAWGKKTSNHKVKRGVRMNGGCNRRAQDLRTSFTRLVRPIFGVGILIKFRLRCYMSELDGWKWALINMSYRQYLPYYTLLTLLKCASMGRVFPFLLIERRIYIFFFLSAFQ